MQFSRFAPRLPVAILCFLTPLTCADAQVVRPNDLGVGDQYRLIFVTSSGRSTTSSAVVDYINFVEEHVDAVPELADLNTTWRPIMSLGSSCATFITDSAPGDYPGVPFYRLDGTRVADDGADLWDGSLLNAISFNENGTFLDSFVWTGTNIDGTTHRFHFGAGHSVIGCTVESGPRWVNFDDTPVYQVVPLPLYGVSGILTVTAQVGDVNLDGLVSLLDVAPFVELLSSGGYQIEADINQDGVLNLFDVSPFIDLLN